MCKQARRQEGKKGSPDVVQYRGPLINPLKNASDPEPFEQTSYFILDIKSYIYR